MHRCGVHSATVEQLAKRFGMLTLGVVAALIPGCKEDDFRCNADAECKIETIQGFCEANNYCSFPAADCDSERRYGAQAGDGLAGQCVPEGDSDTATDGTTTQQGTSTTEPDPPSSSSTTDQNETSGETTGPTTTTGPATDGTSSSSGGSESSTGSSVEMWADDFDRADSPTLGNGWIERTPGSFGLAQGRVVFEGEPVAYQDAVFYRPFDEALLDLELSIEFTHVGAFDFSTPQLHARIQEDSLGPKEQSINAYIVYLSQPDEIQVSRIEGDVFALTGSADIEPPLVAGQTYRLSLRVTGTDPVAIVGSVEGLEGDMWTLIQTALLTDTGETRITEPGSFGASGSNSVTFEYDNFVVVADPL